MLDHEVPLAFWASPDLKDQRVLQEILEVLEVLAAKESRDSQVRIEAVLVNRL